MKLKNNKDWPNEGERVLVKTSVGNLLIGEVIYHKNVEPTIKCSEVYYGAIIVKFKLSSLKGWCYLHELNNELHDPD